MRDRFCFHTETHTKARDSCSICLLFIDVFLIYVCKSYLYKEEFNLSWARHVRFQLTNSDAAELTRVTGVETHRFIKDGVMWASFSLWALILLQSHSQ